MVGENIEDSVVATAEQPDCHAPSMFDVTISDIESNLPGEDRNSVLIGPNVSAFAVFDGHGGSKACEIANSFLINDVVERLKLLPSLDNSDEILRIIDESFQRCDEIVLQEALKKLEVPLDPAKNDAKGELMRRRDAGRPGCCAIIVILIGEYIYAANAG